MKFRSQKLPAAAIRIAVLLYCLSNAARKKIGRNDPCPCDSGRKFKMCCGT
ncbi:MAG: SEC-C metal-binding domain-containing protein [Candidatus Azotimanducaceae bacterium]